MKTELKSWSDVVKKGCSQNQADQVTKKSVKEVMEKVNEEERRACNLMVYGVEESAEDDEDCEKLIADIFDDIMDCLSNVDTVDCYRIGKKETGKTRPIRIECKCRSDAQYSSFMLVS